MVLAYRDDGTIYPSLLISSLAEADDPYLVTAFALLP